MRRAGASALLAVAVLLGLAPATSASAAPRPEVVVLGVGGLRWSDVGPGTPRLRALARDSAVGVLSVKALDAVTCEADGWLTLGAGARASALGAGGPPCTGALPTDLEAVAEANAASRDGALTGALAEALGGSVQAVGAGPRLAVADGGGSGAAGSGSDPVRVRLAWLGAVDVRDRAASLADVDAALGRALDDVPDGATLLLVGLSEARGEDDPHLHVALAHGPGYPRGALVSASTRTPPYVQLVDVAPTVLAVLDVPVPDVMDGQPWRVAGPAPSIATLVDLEGRADAQRRVTVPFFVTAIAGVLALLLLAGGLRRPRAVEAVALAAVAALGATYVANLVPWWRAEPPLLALLVVVTAVAAAVAAAALLLTALIYRGGSATRRGGQPSAEDQRQTSAPRPPTIFDPCPATRRAGGAPPEDRREGRSLLLPAGLVCAFTAGVVLLDLVTGARLQMSSVAGYSPLVAGRFAGIGNVAFGVLGAAAVLATALLVRRVAVVAAVGVLVVVVDGAPPWGSDVGGVLALVPAFTVLGLLLSGRRVSVPRLALAGLAGVAVVTAFALADLARPAADRTHLGRFAADVRDGTAGELLRRKAEAVFGLLLSSPVTALLPLVVAAAVWAVVRPPAPLRRAFALAPALRAGLVATGVLSLFGFLVNDSGAAVPALALLVALPTATAVAARAARFPRASPPL